MEEIAVNRVALHKFVESERLALAIGRTPYLHIRNPWGRHPLFLAVRKGNIDAVQYIVESEVIQDGSQLRKTRVDVNMADPENNGHTPAHELSFYNGRQRGVCLFILKYLLGWGADMNKPAADTLLPLHGFIKRGHTQTARYLLEEGGCMYQIDSYGGPDSWTPLHYAVFFGRIKATKMLTKKGADITRPTGDAEQALPIHLASRGCQLNVLQYLVDQARTPVNVVDATGGTPIHSAASSQSASDADVLNTVRYLTERGVNPKAKNKRGQTALFTATIFRHIPLIRHLHSLNVDIDEADASGKTPLYYAIDGGEGSVGVVVALINLGAKINHVEESTGDTLLHTLVANMSKKEAVKFLLTEGAKAHVQTKNKQGQTPFHLACAKGEMSIVKLLVEHGAAPTDVDSGGNTALHYAATCDKDDHTDARRLLLIRYLVESCKIDAKRKNKKGETALDVARWSSTLPSFGTSSGTHKSLRGSKRASRRSIGIILPGDQSHDDRHTLSPSESTHSVLRSSSFTPEQVWASIMEYLANPDSATPLPEGAFSKIASSASVRDSLRLSSITSLEKISSMKTESPLTNSLHGGASSSMKSVRSIMSVESSGSQGSADGSGRGKRGSVSISSPPPTGAPPSSAYSQPSNRPAGLPAFIPPPPKYNPDIGPQSTSPSEAEAALSAVLRNEGQLAAPLPPAPEKKRSSLKPQMASSLVAALEADSKGGKSKKSVQFGATSTASEDVPPNEEYDEPTDTPVAPPAPLAPSSSAKPPSTPPPPQAPAAPSGSSSSSSSTPSSSKPSTPTPASPAPPTESEDDVTIRRMSAQYSGPLVTSDMQALQGALAAAASSSSSKSSPTTSKPPTPNVAEVGSVRTSLPAPKQLSRKSGADDDLKAGAPDPKRVGSPPPPSPISNAAVPELKTDVNALKSAATANAASSSSSAAAGAKDKAAPVPVKQSAARRSPAKKKGSSPPKAPSTPEPPKTTAHAAPVAPTAPASGKKAVSPTKPEPVSPAGIAAANGGKGNSSKASAGASTGGAEAAKTKAKSPSSKSPRHRPMGTRAAALAEKFNKGGPAPKPGPSPSRPTANQGARAMYIRQSRAPSITIDTIGMRPKSPGRAEARIGGRVVTPTASPARPKAGAGSRSAAQPALVSTPDVPPTPDDKAVAPPSSDSEDAPKKSLMGRLGAFVRRQAPKKEDINVPPAGNKKAGNKTPPSSAPAVPTGNKGKKEDPSSSTSTPSAASSTPSSSGTTDPPAATPKGSSKTPPASPRGPKGTSPSGSSSKAPPSAPAAPSAPPPPSSKGSTPSNSAPTSTTTSPSGSARKPPTPTPPEPSPSGSSSSSSASNTDKKKEPKDDKKDKDGEKKPAGEKKQPAAPPKPALPPPPSVKSSKSSAGTSQAETDMDAWFKKKAPRKSSTTEEDDKADVYRSLTLSPTDKK